MLRSQRQIRAFLLMWVAAVGVSSSLGVQRAQGLGACVICNCKMVYNWYTGPANPAYFGFMQTGTANPVLNALPNIQALTGTCPAGFYHITSGQCDIWEFDSAYFTCDPAADVVSEIVPRDFGMKTTLFSSYANCNGSGGGTGS